VRSVGIDYHFFFLGAPPESAWPPARISLAARISLVDAFQKLLFHEKPDKRAVSCALLI
jgi:hypothetical protein